jgi:hypothetical protein
MKIIHSRPPNFDAIAKVFPQAFGRNVLFAYGDVIYAPFVTAVPPHLVAHETVHGQRQLEHDGGPTGWWNRYLHDVLFRYHEELLAHRAEYWALTDKNPSRAIRRSALGEIAKRLASPLYGRMVTFNQAKEDLLA